MLAVVIVTYHSSEVVADCLKSVRLALRDQGPARVIVVDNASADDTVDLVRRIDPAAEVVRMERNKGFAGGVNAGILAAPGCDVLVLNPDVRLDPDAIARLRETLTVPGTGIAVPELTHEDGSLQLSLRRRPTVLRAIGEALLGGRRAGRFAPLGELVVDRSHYARERTVDWATGAAWMISRACVETLGLLDERYFLYSEETEYMLRAGEHGFALRYQPRARAVHIGGAQKTSAPLWALSAANRVRLHRERHGRVRALAMRAAVLVNEGLRAVGKGGARGHRHRLALRALLPLPRWPAGQEPPGYLCFSAQDWWYHNQAHSDFQLMRSVAKHRKVLVVNSIGMRMPTPGRSTQPLRRIGRKLRSVAKFVREPLPGFHVMSPLPLPFYGSPLLRKVNAVLVRTQVRAVCRALGLTEPVIMTTIPTAWDVVQPMRRRSLLFNRSDRHSAFPESDTATIEELENALLRHADQVLYVSSSLMAEERGQTGARAHFLDHGVDLEHFTRTDRLPADLAAIPGPRVGFFGALDDYLVDFDLLERIAADLPDVSLVLLGDATVPMERLTKYPNVHWLGFRPYDDIPAYGSGFDVAIMPWLDNSWIRHANPIKLKEYLALGLPVVSTDFAELANYTDRVRIATNPADFIAAIRSTLHDGGLRESQALRMSVRGASWSSRAAELMALAEAPPRRV